MKGDGQGDRESPLMKKSAMALKDFSFALASADDSAARRTSVGSGRVGYVREEGGNENTEVV